MRATISIIALLVVLSVSAQKALRDSLLLQITSYEAKDTGYVDLLNRLAFEYTKSYPSQSIQYINRAIAIADSIGYTQGLVRATTLKGNSVWVVGLQDQALAYYLQALSIGGNDIPIDRARINNNIGEVFKRKKLYDSALKYYRQAHQAALLVTHLKPVMITSNIAEAFLLKGAIDSATNYYERGLALAKESNHERGMANAYAGLAELNFKNGNVNQAILLQNESLRLGLKVEDQRRVIQTYLRLAEYYFNNDLKACSVNIRNAKILASSIKANDLLLEVGYLEYRYLMSITNYQDAAIVLDNYQQLKDSLRAAEFTDAIDKMKSSLLAEIRSQENQLLIQEQATNARKNRFNMILIVSVSILLIITIRLIYLFRERRRLGKHQQEKDILIDKLKIRNKNLKEFNSIISHNLREPLTQIIGYAKFYENGNSSIEVDSVIKHVKRSAFRIDQTIRDLSTVLNEKEPTESDYRAFHLRELVEEVINSFEGYFMDTKPRINIGICDDFQVFSYKPFVQDILYHLISNSIRFRSEKHQLEIGINATTTDDAVEISVKDNGVGFDPERIGTKIFKMHQTFHSESNSRGLGLYIVKNRLDALHGTIAFTSEIEKGSEFTVSLPINSYISEPKA